MVQNPWLMSAIFAKASIFRTSRTSLNHPITMAAGMSCTSISETAGFFLGVLGDATTFTGAIILALKEAGEEEKAREARDILKVYERNGRLKEKEIRIEGVLIECEKDIEIALAKRASRRSRLGAVFLAVGFIFLLFSRLLESKDVIYGLIHH